MKIEDGVPMPTQTGSGRWTKYPFAVMEVGQSVFFEGEKMGDKCLPYAAAKMTAHRSGKKFSGRSVEGGVRIWRVS